MIENREILIGATGGIAVYKTAYLTSHLIQAGAHVSVVMTESATRLVAPRTFEALTGRPVRISLWDSDRPIPHVDLSQKAELFCVVPATANFIGKAANGIADDLLSTIYLAFEGPVLIAPAMNTAMWNHPAVVRNVKRLIEDGVQIIGPESGFLSCGRSGIGRMSSPDDIFNAIDGYFHTA
ncbi:MAG: flavoprotein [Planctomycetia bacterium]|nr:flavoprotein [Planctomycetia bacterium]